MLEQLIVTMKTLIVTLTFTCFLSPSVAMAINTSLSTRTSGLCEYVVRQTPPGIPGAFVPSCDFNGNFLPQQCATSTGSCWCVNVITGEEIPNTRTPPGTVPVNCDREFYCPFGWSRFGRLCFVFIDSPKTWVEAESYCMFEGANLASVQSPEQNHFLQALTRAETHNFPPTWVGGHNCVNVLFWMWSDGSRFLYENWNMESNTRTSERCLQMNNGYEKKWDFASCESELPFLCAKRV